MAIIRYQNSNYHTAGELPPVGSRAPDFSLVNTKLQNVSLANWMEKRKLLNIFVSVDTDICAQSVLTFDGYGERLPDVALLMVSYDLPFAHARFAREHRLEHVMGLSAIRHAGFGRNYGVEITEGPLAGMYSHAIIVIDENNTVVYNQRIEDVSTEPDYGAALRALGVRDLD